MELDNFTIFRIKVFYLIEISELNFTVFIKSQVKFLEKACYVLDLIDFLDELFFFLNFYYWIML